MVGTTVGAALDWLFAALYPNSKPSVADPASLPLVGNTINDYRIVTDDGDGKAAGYRWEQREGDASPSWYKVHDMDWSNDSILAALMDQTQEMYVSKYGRMDTDANGNQVAGLLAGQSIYGGTASGSGLTLHANNADPTTSPADQTGYIQFDDDVRPTSDDSFDLGTTTERFRDLFLAGSLADGTVTVTVANLKAAYDHISVTSGNPHDVTYDELVSKLGTLTVNGDATGSVDLSSSGAKTLTLAVVDDSHNHTTSTITDFSSSVWAMIKTALVDNSEANWTFNDTTKEADLDVTVDTSAVTDIDAPSANKILASNALGDTWVAADGTIELTGDVTGSANWNSTTAKWSIGTTVAYSSLSTLTDVTLTNKTFTSVSGAPTTVTATAHGLRTGETVRLFGSVIDTLEKTVTVIDANTFTIPDATASNDSGYYIPEGGQLLYDTALNKFRVAKEYEEIRLGELSGLDEDVLTQYVAIAGRSGGQTVQGGISASENLVLESTANATKGSILAKDRITPFTDAAYSGGWSGTDLGSSTKKWNDLYIAGEAKGLRLENVGSLPVSSGTTVGRLVIFSGKPYYDTGSAYTKIGSGDVTVVSKVGAYTATVDDDVILANGTFTITLPAASGATKRLSIKNIGTGTVTVDGNSTETIDGSLTYDLVDQYASITIVSNGTGWYIL